MGEQRDTDGFDREDMLGGEPKEINAETDNDRLAGLAPFSFPLPIRDQNAIPSAEILR